MAEELSSRFEEMHAHSAQMAYVIAKTMGGFDGDPTAFLLPFANPGMKARPVFVSAGVEAGVRQALAWRLVSQEMLDLLTSHGFRS